MQILGESLARLLAVCCTPMPPAEPVTHLAGLVHSVRPAEQVSGAISRIWLGCQSRAGV